MVARAPPRSDMADAISSGQFRGGGRPTRMAAPIRVAAGEEAATQVVFRLPGAVTVDIGHSLMVPIVDREVPAWQVSLYQADTHARYLLAAVRLTNDSGSGLPPGVLTLYQRSAPSGAVAYVGDARLDTLPVGEKLLVSFALDQKTRVDRKMKRQSTLAQAVINQGTFRRTFTDRQVTTYRIKAPAQEGRSLIIEHPRRQGWALLEPTIDKVELTQRRHRIALDLDSGTEQTLTVVMERPRRETLAVASLSSQQIAALADSRTLTPPIRRAFARLARLRGEVERPRAEIRKLDEERKRIFQDQTRIRGNLNRVPHGSDIHRRYLKKLNRQENRIEQLDGLIKLARGNEQKVLAALAAFIADLNI